MGGVVAVVLLAVVAGFAVRVSVELRSAARAAFLARHSRHRGRFDAVRWLDERWRGGPGPR